MKGIFQLFSATPIWAVALFIFTVGTPLGIIFLIVTRVRGFYFNTSYSGVVGEAFLCFIILIGVTVVQRGKMLPGWFSDVGPQVAWFIISVVACVILTTQTSLLPHNEWSSKFHNFVMMPMFVFLLPLTALAVVYNGKGYEKVAVLLFFLVWGALVIYDLTGDRLDQQKWVEKEIGIHFSREGQVVRAK